MIFCLFVQNLFLKTKLPDNESSVEWRKTDTPVNEDRFQAGVDGGVASLLIGVQHSHLHCWAVVFRNLKLCLSGPEHDNDVQQKEGF